eukprot:gene789-980_t
MPIQSNSTSSSISQLNTTGITNRKISDSYHIIAKIGEGISGSVFKAVKKDSNELVALKNFKGWSESDRASKEECSLLLQLRHIPYITPIIDIYTDLESNEYVIIFPYFEHDLSGLLSEHRLSIPQVKCYFKQLLQGINDIHSAGVMHRDIKAANILVNNKGSLYIGDLGTATSYVKRSVFSCKVVTLWYRAPELLLGATQYGPEIDMWSVGCVLIELVTSRNFLPGSCEQQQLEAICKLCGTPAEENWNGVSQLPNYNMISTMPHYQSKLRTVFKNFSNDFIELLEGLLTLDPKKRLTAAQALESPFFTNHPLPFKPENMPGYQPIHVFEAVQKRLQQQQQQQQPQPTQPSNQQSHFSQQQQIELKKQQELKKLQQQQQMEQQKLKQQQDLLKKKQQEEELKRQQQQQELKRKEQLEKQRLEELKRKEQQQKLEQLKQEQIRIEQQKLEQLKQPVVINSCTNNNNQVNNLKRSLDLVDDIRNYCTTDTESECDDCDSDYYTEDDFSSDEEVDDCDSDDSEIEYFNTNYIFTPIKTFTTTTTSNNNDSSDHIINPFLQPPKKQRTTTPVSTPNFPSLSTPLIIH